MVWLKKLKKAFSLLVNDPRTLADIMVCRYANFLSDEMFLKIRFRVSLGYPLNLKHPKSFNEKLQWLKLNDKHPEYTGMVDKVAVKKYVASIAGNDILIPTIGVWNNVDDIEWNKLPKQFVVKSANDSGGVVVCKDKEKLDIEKTITKLKKLGGRDYSIKSKEYPYKNVPHRYIAEEYIEDESGYELKDYKIFCFDGEPKFLYVVTGRQQNDTRFDFYDIEFNHLPVFNGHPNADVWPEKPKNFEKMLHVARKLSKGIPHVRVDLYNVNGKIYFGELTFFHMSGLYPFKPRKWDYVFGSYLTLPTDKE